jgi:CubicO group peptidase (beta-lactamase class C family)
MQNALDDLLDHAVRRGAVPAVVALAGDRDGTLYEGAAGTPGDTVFALASMTKAMVSVGALQLIEQGRLELEQPVAEVLPRFGELQVLDGFDGDEPILRPPASQATIRQLMTHTSGVSYFFTNADIRRYHELTGTPNVMSGRLACLDVPLVFDPGTRWEYGMGTDWLGQVIEAVSGQDLQAYLREHLWEPLGMPDTTFWPTDEQRGRMFAMQFRPPGAEELTPFPSPEPVKPEYWSGGGGAYGTGADYLRFMRAMLRGGELDGERVLREDTVELAFTDHLHGASLPTFIESAFPELCNDIPSLPVEQGWGLGFHLVLEDLPGMRSAGSGDWAGLFNCYYWIDRARGIAGTMLTQLLPFFDAGAVETFAGFEAGVYAEIAAPSTVQP